MKDILLVGFGGAMESIARYMGQKYISRLYPHTFPIGTFVINIMGCFLIGLFYGLAIKHEYLTPTFRLLLMAGFCGGFTTFSAFTLEGMQLLNQQKFMIFSLYFTFSVLFGLIATFTGCRLTQ